MDILYVLGAMATLAAISYLALIIGCLFVVVSCAGT
jgi:hypothetical protein